ncbi:hypothetical protein NLX83_01830 [Allokutzneria sp. A3M-2-11 16]|uniref:hypothetical protein n=1 Tax=Allokutzneria sp. A3M-2-11 16 TaxID=2962043 RepID=UPI0020B8332D|nr:hypothetical protein [Allokutzneria sp. A3M-2-11 16]MCP3797989.1 hypothetical protein [Allokutzneria sp. A3M-2-11 16]
MSELERLSAQAEIMPLFRTHGGLVVSREARQLQGRLRQEAAEGVIKKAKIAIATDVAMDAMDGVKQVDDFRRTLANGDEGLNSVLAEIEIAYVHHVNRIQRGSAF